MPFLPFSSKKDEEIKIPKPSRTGLQTIREILTPPALEIESTYVRLGDLYTKTYYIISYPRYLTSGWFSPVLNIDQTVDVSIFVQPVDTGVALKQLRRKVAQVEAQLLEREEKGLVRDPVLETAYQDLENLRDALQQAREKLFEVGVYIAIYASNLKELEEIEQKIISFLEGRMVYIKPALFQQSEGLLSCFPLNKDYLSVHSTLNSSPVSTFFPFISLDLTSDKGIFYGINRHNNSLIIFDRFSLENGNMVIFAKSGSGKSYFCKLEVLRSLMMGTDVIIIDPEKEYQHLAETVGGSFINISLTSEHHINPFDLPPPRPDEKPEEVLKSNILNLTGLLRIMLGELTSEQIGILDRAIAETYASRDITPESDFTKLTPPLMEDLQAVLENMEGGAELADRLFKFTRGTFAGFLNKPTNVDIDNRLVVFAIRDLEDELRPIAMYMVLNFIWNLIRSQLKRRILIVDEAWWMMKYPAGADFLFGLVKRCRKYHMGVTTITQDVEDFIRTPQGKPIITNSALQLLLKQSPASIEVVAETFNLTEAEKQLLLSANVGEGIFFAGAKHVAIKVIASYTEDQIITTNPAQMLQIEKAKEMFDKSFGA
ncbi:MAG: ATP-binding protein [Patescibacteria group bacterium]|jgi:type IV secretory pathway VirB4 component|nr:ATP-binding protein [Patescibacteria group bacterium]